MKLQTFVLPVFALTCAGLLFGPGPRGLGFVKSGDTLLVSQRDVRVFNNFEDGGANNNITPDSQFPGQLGAPLALWKGVVEWGSSVHGDGTGDPLQPVLGDGGANFDGAFAGLATGPGNTNHNIMSGLSGGGGACGIPGVIAFAEVPSIDGWRIRFCEANSFNDGPGNPGAFQYDMQAISAHEYGHVLGLDHTPVVGATMEATTSSGPPSAEARSIEPDDIAGVQCIYGVKGATKPEITGVSVAAGMITITGFNFDASSNTLWFTRAAPSLPSIVTPMVELGPVASTGGGTQITATIPVDAGPGDVLVRVPGGGMGIGLSNAWPTDLGQPPIPLASSTFRNGTGINRACLVSVDPPVLDASWQAQVDAAGHPGATVTGMRAHALPSPGIPTGLGEVLIDLSSFKIFTLTMATSGGVDTFSQSVPRDATLLGLSASIQGFVLGGGVELCNAYDIVLGL